MKWWKGRGKEMPYWNDLITQRSWEKLQEMKRRKLRFVLIGGWAIWLYARSHKSKDIDIVVDFEELNRLKQMFDLKKNDRLRKYEFYLGEIDVDVYVPHFSKITIPLEEAVKETREIEGFSVVSQETLLALKQGAEKARGKSEKGLKDRLDIMELLLKADINLKEYNRLLQKHGLQEFKQRLVETVQSFKDGKYLGLNPRELKKAKQQLLKRIKESR